MTAPALDAPSAVVLSVGVVNECRQRIRLAATNGTGWRRMDTGTDVIPRTGDMLRPDQINWILGPVARAEDDNPIDVFALSHDELLAYAYGLQDDMRAVRGVLHAACSRVAELTATLRTKDQTIIHLRQQMRADRGVAA